MEKEFQNKKLSTKTIIKVNLLLNSIYCASFIYFIETSAFGAYKRQAEAIGKGMNGNEMEEDTIEGLNAQQ